MSDELIYPDCPNATYCVGGWHMGKGCYPDDLSSAAGGKPWHDCTCLIDPEGKLETVEQRNARWQADFAKQPLKESERLARELDTLRTQLAAMTAERDQLRRVIELSSGPEQFMQSAIAERDAAVLDADISRKQIAARELERQTEFRTRIAAERERDAALAKVALLREALMQIEAMASPGVELIARNALEKTR